MTLLTDETEAVCREYVERDSRFSYLPTRNSRNLGMPANLNAGLRRTRCEFVANLHDGDIYAPTLIEKWRTALIPLIPAPASCSTVIAILTPDGQTRAIYSRSSGIDEGK